MFDRRRFARLAAAEWIENRRKWAWFLAVLVMVHFVFVLALLAGHEGYESFKTDNQEGHYFFGLFLSAPIFAGLYFQSFARRGPLLLALMRPASVLEKWLLAGLVVGLAYPLAYTLAFYVCDLPAALIARGQAGDVLAALGPAMAGSDIDVQLRNDLDAREFSVFWYFAKQSWRDLLALWLSLGALQAFAVFGSLWFRRMPALKTLLAAFLVLLACLLLTQLSDSEFGPLFEYWEHVQSDRSELGAAQSLLFALAWFGVPGLLWLAAYLALREREVA